MNTLRVDWLANVIRSVDGRHELGAGALAEKIIEAIESASPPVAAQDRVAELVAAVREVMDTELGDMACFGSDAPYEHALGVLKNKLFNLTEAAAQSAPVAAPGDGYQPIERDESMDREYIPMPGGWEVQTKGKGSTFRIAGPDRDDRLAIEPRPYLHETLTNMARAVNAAWKLAAAPTAPPVAVDGDALQGHAGTIIGWWREDAFTDASHDDNPSEFMDRGWQPVALVPPSTAYALPAAPASGDTSHA